MRITVGARGGERDREQPVPMSAASSSWTIFTTCWPGVTDFRDVERPSRARARAATKSFTTLKSMSASSSARRISRIALEIASSSRRPACRGRRGTPWSLSESVSNISGPVYWRRGRFTMSAERFLRRVALGALGSPQVSRRRPRPACAASTTRSGRRERLRLPAGRVELRPPASAPKSTARASRSRRRTSTCRRTGRPPAYPSLYRGCHWGSCSAPSALPIRVSAVKRITSSWVTKQPTNAVFDVTYDLWTNTKEWTNAQPDGSEVMIWIGSRGRIQPAGKRVGVGEARPARRGRSGRAA